MNKREPTLALYNINDEKRGIVIRDGQTNAELLRMPLDTAIEILLKHENRK